jgi:hypothetical protein
MVTQRSRGVGLAKATEDILDTDDEFSRHEVQTYTLLDIRTRLFRQ